ncbi:hypothetical protein [Clostridium saccharoperbutylacetonicum]|uniref:hypothetical protein n=1 Tax=Clostridium saccharoperbutylacetonicum TaxID=36745 RepID=UPI0039EA6138
MAINDLTVDLDLKQNLNIYTVCKQLDELALICNIYDNSVQADLANYNVRLVAMKSDNIPLVQEHTGITLLNNIVKIEADSQLTTTSGKTLIELQFNNKITGKRKATFNLVLNVIPSALEVNASISTATYTLLQELENKLDQAGDYLQNIDQAIELNNELKKQNTNATSNVLNLNTQNTNATKNISDLMSQNNGASPNISNLEIQNTQAETNIEALKKLGDVTQLAQDVTNLKTEIQTARGTESNLDARLDKVDTSLSEIAKKESDLTSIPFLSGFTAEDTTSINGYTKMKDETVKIWFACSGTFSASTSWQSIATLPSGYRPSKIVYNSGNLNSIFTPIRVDSSGSLLAYMSTSGNSLRGYIEFLASK